MPSINGLNKNRSEHMASKEKKNLKDTITRIYSRSLNILFIKCIIQETYGKYTSIYFITIGHGQHTSTKLMLQSLTWKLETYKHT